MTRPRLTTAAEIAHVLTYGVGVLSAELRPAVRLHLRLEIATLEETIAACDLAADSPEALALTRARAALDALAALADPVRPQSPDRLT